MSSVIQLGRLKKVSLSEAWPDEARNFTPWLAEPENVGKLGQALDLDLEVISTEEWVGSYRADIFAKDLQTNAKVLIENQIKASDHKHLGQLLTYAAGLDASLICWIAERFSDQHLAALSWLNENTTESCRFFAVEIELWQIGDSPPAPKFNVVSKPNEWARSVARSVSARIRGEPEGIDINRVAYWETLTNYLPENDTILLRKSSAPRLGFYSFTVDPSINAYIYAFRNAALHEIGVSFNFSDKNGFAETIWLQLQNEREVINKQLAADVEWVVTKPKTNYRIRVVANHCDVFDETDWPRQMSWIVEKLRDFAKVFVPQLSTIREKLRMSGEGV